MTVTIQIGNTDNKLTQQEWSCYVEDLDTALNSIPGLNRHFFGGSINWAPWQNACWVIETSLAPGDLESVLRSIRRKYRQESVAVTYGETQFI